MFCKCFTWMPDNIPWLIFSFTVKFPLRQSPSVTILSWWEKWLRLYLERSHSNHPLSEKSKLVLQMLWKLFYNCSRIKKLTKKIRWRNQWFHIFNLWDRHILFCKMWNSHPVDIFFCLPLLPTIVLSLQEYHISRKQGRIHGTVWNYQLLRMHFLLRFGQKNC